MNKSVFQKGGIDQLRKSRPWGVALLCAIILLGVVGGYFVRLGGNTGSFICIGDRFIPPGKLDPGIPYLKNSAGYDGQFFYLIAHDPWILSDYYKYIDGPGYRYQRIFYPLLVHWTAGGDPRNYPDRMVQINFVAIILGAFFVARFLASQGRSSLWAVVFAFLGGNLLGLFRDLADPLGLTLTVLALILYESRRFWGCALWLSAALLTREIYLPIAVLMILDQGFQRRQFRKAAICATALIPFVLWQGYIYIRFGAFLRQGVGNNFDMPFLGLVQRFLSGRGLSQDGYCLAAFILVLLFTLFSAVREVRRCPDALSMSFLFFSLLPLLGSHNVWPEPWAYGRLLLPSAGLLLICYARSGRCGDRIALGLNLVATAGVLKWLIF